MERSSLWLPLFLLLASSLSSAHAQSSVSRDPGWEFGIELIYQLSSDLDFDGGTTASTEDDLGFSATFGYRFNPRLSAEFAFDWANVDYRASLVSAATPAQSLDVRGEYELFAPRASVNFNLLEGDLTPYVTGGIACASATCANGWISATHPDRRVGTSSVST